MYSSNACKGCMHFWLLQGCDIRFSDIQSGMEQYLGGSERPLCEMCAWLCRAGSIRSAHLGSGPGTSGKLDSGIACNTK